MDIGSAFTVISGIGVGFGGYIGGRLQGRSTSSQIAADTVSMLSEQVDLLKEDKDANELHILDLTQRVAVLEGLVTQRAEVEELSGKVDLVKETVDKIAVKVGAS
jgi:hypothetical protein